jgi:hypothetical protein
MRRKRTATFDDLPGDQLVAATSTMVGLVFVSAFVVLWLRRLLRRSHDRAA